MSNHGHVIYNYQREVQAHKCYAGPGTDPPRLYMGVSETPQTLMLVVKGTVSMSCPRVMFSLENGKHDNYYFYHRLK